MNKSAPLELEIASLANDGRGIAFLPNEKGGKGKAIFVEGALPTQKVLCAFGKDHGSWQEAELIRILDAGENNAPPICPQADKCGACPLQAMPYEKQLQWKEKFLLDAMRRIGGYSDAELASAWTGLEKSPDQLAFRNKIELAFGVSESGQPYPGMRRRSSHEVIPIQRCSLVDEEANKIVSSFASLLTGWQWPEKFWRFLVLRKDMDDDGLSRWRLLAISTPGSAADYAKVRQLAEGLLAEREKLFSFTHEVRKAPSMIAKGEKRIFSLGQDNMKGQANVTLSLPLGGRVFKTDVGSFFQVNDKASEKLASLVLKADSLCENKNALLDLYCGAGAPGLLLAPNYKSYLGMELDATAIAHARQNALNLPHCSFQAGDVAKLINRLPPDFVQAISTVLLDPPRAGLDRQVTESLLKMAPQNIIMVSCNPATLARDARLLARDYTLKSLAGADLFPHTPHVEACGLWTRKK